MIFAKTNIPVRIFYRMPDYDETKGVQAEIRREGTEDAGSVIIKTLNLLHLDDSEGLYEAFYSPPSGNERLMVDYIIYTDITYETKDTTTSPGSEQLVLNSGVGQLGGGSISGAVVKPINDAIRKEIAQEVWKAKLSGIADEDSAAFWLKSRSPISLKDLEKIDTDLKVRLSKLDSSIKKVEVNTENQIIDNNKKVINSVNKINNLLLEDIRKESVLVNRIGLLVTEGKNTTNNSAKELKRFITERETKFNKLAQGIMDIIQEIKKNNKTLSNEQTTILKGFMNKLITANADIHSSLVNEVNKIINTNMSVHFSRLDEIKDMINDI